MEKTTIAIPHELKEQIQEFGSKGETYTEFYILNENGTTENYPTNLTIGENGMVIVGVICHEHEKTKYTVEIELINLTGERENRTLGQYNFTLEHDQLNETP